MARIFLSYRRADGVASGARSLIYQKLEEHYGPKSVFMDVERMQVARDFRDCLHEEVSTTDVMLLLIGPEWEQIMIDRADHEADFVRIEIETALELDKPILPILLGGAKMPRPERLPKSISSFAWNHGVELDTGRYFNEGIERLLSDMDEHVFKGEVQYRPKPKPKLIAAVAVVALVVLAGAAILIKNALTTDEVADRTGKIAEETDKIAEETEKIAEDTEKIEENTARAADAAEKAAEGFALLKKAGGTIDNPVAAHEFYHNARIYELRGDYASARKAYLGYFKFNEQKLDPHLRYLDFLKVQEGREGARETYAVVVSRGGGFIPNYASALLWDRERRIKLLEEFKKSQSDFAAVHYHLSLEYSATRLGSQSISDRRAEKEHLEKFMEQDKAGQLVKYFIDQELVTTWRSDATKRLEVANSVDKKMLENPVNLTWMSSNAGWHGNIAIAEPAQDIWWKTADMADFKKNPRTNNIDTRTGQARPNPGFVLSIRQPATSLEVKYVDRNGTERGPFKFEFKPKTEGWAGGISTLNSLPTAWIAYREFNGKLLVYFSHVVAYRGALSKIEYGIDVEMPDQEWEFPAWDKPGIGPITEDVKIHRDIPKDTKFMTVRLSYKDGTKSEVVKFPR